MAKGDGNKKLSRVYPLFISQSQSQEERQVKVKVKQIANGKSKTKEYYSAYCRLV
jgi:hypothetical protein